MNNSLTNISPILVGAIAAIVFCFMVYAFSTMGVLILIPVLLGALPVYIAALGWGTVAGVVATLSIIAINAVMTDISNSILIGFMIAAPAALAGHQANLAQSADDNGDQMLWYPFSQILYWITIMITGAVIFFGILIEFDPNKLAPQFADQFEQLFQSIEGGSKLSEDDRNKALMTQIQMMPFLLPSFWVALHYLNLLLGMKITRNMNVLARPKEDIAAIVGLPQIAMATLVISLIGMILASPPISYMFSVAAGAHVMAFSIVGLAMLHKHIRHWPARPVILSLTYVTILFVVIPIYLFSFAGIFRVAGQIQQKPEQPE